MIFFAELLLFFDKTQSSALSRPLLHKRARTFSSRTSRGVLFVARVIIMSNFPDTINTLNQACRSREISICLANKFSQSVIQEKYEDN